MKEMVLVSESVTYRVVPEEALLALRALARQIRSGIVLADGKVNPIHVETLHVELARKALTLMGE